MPAFANEKPLIILLGPPGAGKGTHAVRISQKMNLPHIATGDLFRDHLKRDTELGKKVKTYMDKGDLVPDELVIDMLFDRMGQKDCQKGCILDGFPRTVNQAKILDKRIDDLYKKILINIQVQDDSLVDRIVGRWVCPNCGAPYHIKNQPPKKEGICDKCQTALIHRKDDTKEVVKNRLDHYHKDTAPILQYYNDQVVNVNGEKSLESVYSDIIKSLEESMSR